MNLDRRIRRSAEEAGDLFESAPVPTLPQRRPWGPAGAIATALVVLVVFGLVGVLNQPDDSGPALTVRPATTLGTTAPSTTGRESGAEPLRLDNGVSLVTVEMGDGTRFAILLPTSLVPGAIEITTGVSNAEINGPGFQGSLSYALCPGDTQDAGSLNSRGALVARVSDRLTVCRPDQLLILDITTRDEVPAESFDAFDIVPVDVGDEYTAAVDNSAVSTFCCEPFGPIQLGSLVITANRHTSGQITAWDYDTLIPQWTVDMGDSSILLGALDDLVVATPGRGVLAGLDARTGVTRWALELGDNEEVVGVGSETGAYEWYVSTEFPMEGEVAVPSLRAVNIRSGELTWMAQMRSETFLQWADPAVFPDTIVVMDVPRAVEVGGTTTTSHLIAFDRATGNQLWATDLEDPTEGFSDGLLAHDPESNLLIAATPGGEVFSVDPETGQILWRTETGFVRIVDLDDQAVTLQRGSDQLELDLQTGKTIER
ncbi:MAG: PQQ-binding-like beta-propeller repeat protein [Actinobacteria bacterium]|nr:PQQ-binding-like beta-propeller repeat protein [Actinomycetota bacterium]